MWKHINISIPTLLNTHTTFIVMRKLLTFVNNPWKGSTPENPCNHHLIQISHLNWRWIFPENTCTFFKQFFNKCSKWIKYLKIKQCMKYFISFIQSENKDITNIKNWRFKNDGIPSWLQWEFQYTPNSLSIHILFFLLSSILDERQGVLAAQIHAMYDFLYPTYWKEKFLQWQK